MKPRASQAAYGGQPRRGRCLCAIALVATSAMLLVPAGASAAAPVLEFVVPGHTLPVSFTTESGEVTAEMAGFETLVHCTAAHGEGEITGPRATVSEYRLTGCSAGGQKCKSADASKEEEIDTGPIDGDLVYIDQARREVGVLLNPGGGVYIAFKCGGESAEGQGPFLAPVGPIDQEATSFTATLKQFDSVQAPDQYEGEKGEQLEATPTGRRESNPFVPTGVELAMTVHTGVPVKVEAVTAGEIEARQHEEEAEEQDESLQKLEATLKTQEEAFKKAEEHAQADREEARKHEEELTGQIAAIKKRQEEEAAASKEHQEEEAAANKRRQEEGAAKRKQEESKPPTRAQLLSKALKQCKKAPKDRRAQCVAAATKKYGHKAKSARKQRSGGA